MQDIGSLLETGRGAVAGSESLAALDEVTAVVDVTGILARIHQAEIGAGRPTLPERRDDVLYAFDLLADSGRDDELRALVTPDLTRARVAVRLHAIGTAEGERVIARIEAVAASRLGGELQATPTGSFGAGMACFCFAASSSCSSVSRTKVVCRSSMSRSWAPSRRSNISRAVSTSARAWVHAPGATTTMTSRGGLRQPKRSLPRSPTSRNTRPGRSR